jgi:hypothetical protein
MSSFLLGMSGMFVEVAEPTSGEVMGLGCNDEQCKACAGSDSVAC